MVREAEGVALQRAERFTLALPIRYRPRGTDRWAEGRSLNISRTGVLISTSEPPLSCGDAIDFLICLPPIEGASGGEARCTGRVARVVLPAVEGDQAAIGVTIDRYVLAPESGASRQQQGESGTPGASR